jgi:hypothetical protein
MGVFIENLITGRDFRAMLERYGISLREFGLRTGRNEKYFVRFLAKHADEKIPLIHLDSLKDMIGEKSYEIVLEHVQLDKNKARFGDETTVIDENGVPVAAWSYHKPQKGKRKYPKEPINFGLTDEELEAKIEFVGL